MASLVAKTSLISRPRPAVASRRVARIATVVRSQPSKAQMDEKVSKAIKEAEETCAQTPGAPCAVAWDEVEEISAAAADKKKVASQDPLEAFCKDAPDADECRVYED